MASARGRTLQLTAASGDGGHVFMIGRMVNPDGERKLALPSALTPALSPEERG